MTDNLQSVDDLQYDWPPNIVNYDTRYFAGLTINDLMGAIAGFLLAMLVNFWLSPVGGILGLLLVKPFEAFGDCRLPQYLWAIILHRLHPKTVTLPRILPTTSSSYQITYADGTFLAEIDGE